MEYTIEEMERMAMYLGTIYRKDIFSETMEIQEDETVYFRMDFHTWIHVALMKMEKEARELILHEFLLCDCIKRKESGQNESAYKQAKNIALTTFFSLLK